MTDEELDAIVQAIGDESFVTSAMRFAAWFVPMALAYIPIYRTKQEWLLGEPLTTRRDYAVSATLFGTGVVVLLFQKLGKR